MKTIKEYYTSIPDFPAPGVIFRDVTSVISDPDGFRLAVKEMMALVDPADFDVVIGIEARGFIFGSVMAYEWGKSFVTARKPGKLPRETVSTTYELEYGSAGMEIHTDAVRPGDRVLIVDDLIATGGTAKACAELVEKLEGKVAGFVFLASLSEFDWQSKLAPYPVQSVIQF